MSYVTMRGSVAFDIVPLKCFLYDQKYQISRKYNILKDFLNPKHQYTIINRQSKSY